MLEVDINKIIPVTDARANIATLVNEVMKGNFYVLTRGGKPAAVIAPVTMAENIIVRKNLAATTPKSKIQPVAVQPRQTSSLQIQSKSNNKPLTAESTKSMPLTPAEENPAIDLSKINQALEQLEKPQSASLPPRQ